MNVKKNNNQSDLEDVALQPGCDSAYSVDSKLSRITTNATGPKYRAQVKGEQEENGLD